MRRSKPASFAVFGTVTTRNIRTTTHLMSPYSEKYSRRGSEAFLQQSGCQRNQRGNSTAYPYRPSTGDSAVKFVTCDIVREVFCGRSLPSTPLSAVSDDCLVNFVGHSGARGMRALILLVCILATAYSAAPIRVLVDRRCGEFEPNAGTQRRLKASLATNVTWEDFTRGMSRKAGFGGSEKAVFFDLDGAQILDPSELDDKPVLLLSGCSTVAGKRVQWHGLSNSMRRTDVQSRVESSSGRNARVDGAERRGDSSQEAEASLPTPPPSSPLVQTSYSEGAPRPTEETPSASKPASGPIKFGDAPSTAEKLDSGLGYVELMAW